MNAIVVAACQKKVTVYIGTKKYEVSWIEVARGPYAQYLDAFHFKLKPRGARKIRTFVEHYRPRTVVIEGWGHPEFDWLIRSIHEAPVVEASPGVTYRMTSLTIRNGEPITNDKYELELENYILRLMPDKIILDTRGIIVNKKHANRASSSPLNY